jgi:hypothetical protein
MDKIYRSQESYPSQFALMRLPLPVKAIRFLQCISSSPVAPPAGSFDIWVEYKPVLAENIAVIQHNA